MINNPSILNMSPAIVKSYQYPTNHYQKYKLKPKKSPKKIHVGQGGASGNGSSESLVVFNTTMTSGFNNENKKEQKTLQNSGGSQNKSPKLHGINSS